MPSSLPARPSALRSLHSGVRNREAHGPRVLDGLFVLFRTATLHGVDHPMVQAAAQRLGALLDKSGPMEFQFVEGMVFRSGRLLPLEPEDHARGLVLSEALARREVDEVHLHTSDPTALHSLAAALLDPAVEPAPGVAFDTHESARGDQKEEVAPEVFAATQLALAVADAEALRAQETWSFRLALSIVRRVERAWAKAPGYAGSVLERAPGEWSPARRAVAALSHVMAALIRLEASRSVRRVVGHATLACGLVGLRRRGGVEFEEAVRRASELLESTPNKRRHVDPHRQRLLAMLRTVARGRETLTVGPLVQLGYGLELARCPRGSEGHLEIGELFAHAAGNMGRLFDPRWVRAFISLHGVFPAGARVQLEDGRIGVALGPGARADRPLVLVDGQLHEPTGPVSLVSLTSGDVAQAGAA